MQEYDYYINAKNAFINNQYGHTWQHLRVNKFQVKYN